MKTIDPGHRYLLLSLDGGEPQELVFVKRCNPPERYPGNTNAHPGTTLQAVIRCLIERFHYLQGQFWCVENWIAIRLLMFVLWLLEFRAARRHGLSYWHSPHFATYAPLCPQCGHTQCHHHDCCN